MRSHDAVLAPSPPVGDASAPRRAAVITVSDRAAAGTRDDATGPLIVAALRDAGFVIEPASARIVADGVDSVRRAVVDAHAAGARLIVTTGGTGIGPRDRTPEAVRPLLDLELSALAAAITTAPDAPPTSLLSRAVAGVIGADASPGTSALVVTLPGSVGGVRDGLAALLPLAHHAIGQLDGRDHTPTVASRTAGTVHPAGTAHPAAAQQRDETPRAETTVVPS